MAAFIVVIGVGLPIWLLLSTRYTLEPRQLRVQSGPFKWHIKVADITSITPSSNALSSPALSLDRLRIDYGSGRSLMISPRNKERFLRDIEAARRGAA
ncbi:PH domain-containing protein [Luteimonas sp. MC1750]|uniref:PH domain-containing protein n=1 Tax=Luteimonas sp. MC1750 TaxID=2799326 RepID=UPI00190E0AC2|nr:PH domain-containing protein [Luteimonas sp. MC1750]QQO05935.1 PH domain-containing protein [Luteimonas sp. MC1750]